MLLTAGGAALAAVLLLACGDGDGGPQATATPPAGTEALRPIPTSAPAVVGVISDFLLIEGREFFPAIPPCTGFQSQPDEELVFPLTVGVVPEGAVETDSVVEVCPDGTISAAVQEYDFPDQPERYFRVAYFRAPHSFPLVLADPAVHRIEGVQVNGRRGLLLVPERAFEFYGSALLRFWVIEQVDQRAGAFVEVSMDPLAPDVAGQLLRVGESIDVHVVEPFP